MSELDVRIVRLDPVRVASAHGFGPSPEGIAWDKILAFARPKGLDKAPGVRYFGFNNPDPTPGSPNYGYEQWITVGPDAQAEGDVEIKDFEGGLFAVTRCKLPVITETWQRLVAWLEDSPHYHWGSGQLCLEEALSVPDTPFEDVVMDLYLPVAE